MNLYLAFWLEQSLLLLLRVKYQAVWAANELQAGRTNTTRMSELTKQGLRCGDDPVGFTNHFIS